MRSSALPELLAGLSALLAFIGPDEGLPCVEDGLLPADALEEVEDRLL